MCNYEISQVLNLYTHAPAFLVSLLLSFIVLMVDKKNPVNRNLFVFIFSFCLWIVNDFFQLLVSHSSIKLFLGKIAILESIALLFFLFFSYALVGKDLSFKKKALFSIPFLPILVLMFTKYNAVLIDQKSCNIQFGILYWYIYVFLLFYMVWSVRVLFARSKSNSVDDKLKKQFSAIMKGIIFGILWFVLFIALMEWAATNGYAWGDSVFMFTPVGMIVFMGFLAFAITQYQFLKIKIIVSQVLTYLIWIVIGSMYFFASSTINIILITFSLFLAIIFGLILIKSVKQEIKQKDELVKANKEINERKDELQLMAEKLAQANDQLRVLDNAKTEFISIASHQLRTPLTAVKGFISMLLEGSYGKLQKQQEDVLNKVYISNERLVNLVEDLLNVSRMESGRMEFKFANWDMAKICKDVYDTFVLKAKEHDLYLECNLPEQALPEVMIDGVKVREVVSNLLDNAIKYTLEGHGGVKLKLEQLGENIRVTISDTGIGIPQTELPYLFAKFSRGKDISRLNTGGTGLGLYVGKSMIESNGGRIWAESDGQDLGSRFIIEIPVKQSEELLKKWA
jgi:signal transduction histidine kinase